MPKVSSRAYTATEVREGLLEHLRGLARYWAELPGKSAQERCDGLAFSILNVFDGTTLVLPAMDISLAPHSSDRGENKRLGAKWFQPGMVINRCMLHELYYVREEPAVAGTALKDDPAIVSVTTHKLEEDT